MTEAIEWAPGSYWLVRTEEIAKDISALWHICRFVASAKSIVMARKRRSCTGKSWPLCPIYVANLSEEEGEQSRGEGNVVGGLRGVLVLFQSIFGELVNFDEYLEGC